MRYKDTLVNPIPFESYHEAMKEAGDCDPAYAMLRYLAERFELNVEQRYWLCWLYSTCYCGPTAFFMYNDFPDFENVDVGRLQRWWDLNRHRLLFQTDRRWARSKNEWVDMFRSYKFHVEQFRTQELMFKRLLADTPEQTYRRAFSEMGTLMNFGRYSLFLYLEAVHVVTEFPMKPSSMNLSEAESSRNGLAYAINREDLVTHGTDKKLNTNEMNFLQFKFDELASKKKGTDTIWELETTLCAYKKYRIGKRYVGYYLDRQLDEINQMTKAVPEGVCWKVLNDYRRETYKKKWLKEAR